jgi:Domain of unknown function (DUF4157)
MKARATGVRRNPGQVSAPKVSRSFGTAAGPAPSPEPYDFETRIRSAELLGHNLGRFQAGRETPPPAQQTPVQAKRGKVAGGPGRSPARAGRGKPLPARVRQKMEGALGSDFSDVRIHEGSDAESLEAVAFTRGTDIHFAPGAYSPESLKGQEVLGHELAHVVQQRAGRVALPKGAGAPINADPGLEAEAEGLGKQAARSRPPAFFGRAERPATPAAPATAGPGALQPMAPVQRAHKKKKKSSGGAGKLARHQEGQRQVAQQNKNQIFQQAKKSGDTRAKSTILRDAKKRGGGRRGRG